MLCLLGCPDLFPFVFVESRTLTLLESNEVRSRFHAVLLLF